MRWNEKGARGLKRAERRGETQQAHELLPPPLTPPPQQQLQSTTTPPPWPPPPAAKLENEQGESGRGCSDDERFHGSLVVRLKYDLLCC